MKSQSDQTAPRRTDDRPAGGSRRVARRSVRAAAVLTVALAAWGVTAGAASPGAPAQQTHSGELTRSLDAGPSSEGRIVEPMTVALIGRYHVDVVAGEDAGETMVARLGVRTVRFDHGCGTTRAKTGHALRLGERGPMVLRSIRETGDCADRLAVAELLERVRTYHVTGRHTLLADESGRTLLDLRRTGQMIVLYP